LKAQTSKRRKDEAPLGYLGQAALRRKKYNGFDQFVARQQFCKNVPTRNNRGSCIFLVGGDVM
jgi:hypothetical protein